MLVAGGKSDDRVRTHFRQEEVRVLVATSSTRSLTEANSQLVEQPGRVGIGVGGLSNSEGMLGRGICLKGESRAVDERPIAYPVEFRGPSTYAKSFDGACFGVVFEDDGETGYLYATNEKADKIFDALHLYNSKNPNKPSSGDKLFIVWNPKMK